jgi:hypothetical protein
MIFFLKTPAKFIKKGLQNATKADILILAPMGLTKMKKRGFSP